jgi:DNA polymerase III subunit delta
MSFQAFLNETAKGLPAPVYLFYAPDTFIHKEAVAAIRNLVPENESDFNLHIFDLLSPVDESPSFEKILDVANTVSFFGGRRITVLLANLQKLGKPNIERLKGYILKPSPASVFVIFHNGVLSKDMRDRLKGVKPVPIDIRESEMPLWMKQRAGTKGIELSDEAAEFLIGLVGPDLGMLSAEIEKISLVGKKRIDKEDISEIIPGGRLYAVFDLVNALAQKDPGNVFRIYKSLKETSEDYGLIGALNWQYGRNLQSGRSPAENEYLTRIFELLNAADIEIKSSGRSFPVEYLLFKLLRLRTGR